MNRPAKTPRKILTESEMIGSRVSKGELASMVREYYRLNRLAERYRLALKQHRVDGFSGM